MLRLTEDEIRQCVLDAKIDFSDFCCEVCVNFSRYTDECLESGDVNIAWRAHRTCCGKKEWHIPCRSEHDYREWTRELECVVSSEEQKVFISSYAKRNFLKYAKYIETVLKLKERS